MNIQLFIQLVINGLLLGMFYATMALGFSTIWGVMRLINLAHGEFLMMGAFVSWFFFNPTREQSFHLSTGNPYITVSAFIFFAVLIGRIVSEFDVVKVRIPDRRPRILTSILAAVAGFIVIYLVWSTFDFKTIDVSMMFLVFSGIALTLGFHISHLILGRGLEWGTLWQRRLTGYSIGAIVSVSMYALWHEQGYPSIDPFVGLPIIFVLFFGLGYIIQNGFLNRLVEGPYLTMLLVTFAMSIAMQNLGLQVYAADPRRINVSYNRAINLTDTITLPPTRLILTVVALIMIFGLIAFLRYTRIGYAIRAAAQNKMSAKLMGINIKETYAITFALSIALTGMAGAMMGTFQPITPVDGPTFTLRAFSIVALGGLGKVEGVVVGGLVLGVAESMVGGYVSTGWALTVAFILLVVMLVLRPQGITGGVVTEES